MPLFSPRETLAQKFTPKAIKLADIYKQKSGKTILPSSVRDQIQKTLTNAGFDPKKINGLVKENKALPKYKMEQVLNHLSKEKIYGFDQNPKIAINNYLKKERVKRMSIDSLKHDRVLESRQEILDPASRTPSRPKLPY